MSISLFECPTPTVLPAISDPDCTVSYGNIFAIAFQLKQATPTFAEATIDLLATWTAALALDTAAAVRVIPVTGFSTTVGEPITEGGNDGTTRKNRTKFKGMGSTSVACMSEGISATLAKEIAALTKFSNLSQNRSNLRAFLLTDENYILSADDYNGLDIWNFTISDNVIEVAFKPETKHNITFGMDHGWSMELEATKAAFDVLALVNG